MNLLAHNSLLMKDQNGSAFAHNSLTIKDQNGSVFAHDSLLMIFPHTQSGKGLMKSPIYIHYFFFYKKGVYKKPRLRMPKK